MQYKVTQQYQRGLEQSAKTFVKEADARAYMQEQLAYNASMKIQVVFRLYDFDDVMAEMDSTNFKPEAAASGESSGASSGKSSGANFRPSPLQTSLRPGGMPNNWKDDDKKKD
jgi:hypothetical protein